ncbi:MAG: hypothetical protein QW095_02045, partial [Nitrososphaerota archaeon]
IIGLGNCLTNSTISFDIICNCSFTFLLSLSLNSGELITILDEKNSFEIGEAPLTELERKAVEWFSKVFLLHEGI